MENAFDSVTRAVREAREVERVVKSQTNNLLELATPNLRKADPFRLKELKREFQKFDSTKLKWKE